MRKSNNGKHLRYGMMFDHKSVDKDKLGPLGCSASLPRAAKALNLRIVEMTL